MIVMSVDWQWFVGKCVQLWFVGSVFCVSNWCNVFQMVNGFIMLVGFDCVFSVCIGGGVQVSGFWEVVCDFGYLLVSGVMFVYLFCEFGCVIVVGMVGYSYLEVD